MSLFSSGFLMSLRLPEGRPNDRYKFRRVQAVTANKSAIDIRLHKERRCVRRLDAAAVLYAKRISRGRPEKLSEAVPNLRVCVLSLLRGGVVSSAADGPDRLVSDRHASQDILWNMGQSQAKLPVQHCFRVPGIALVQGLTDAEEDIEAGIECGEDLLVDERVGFT